MKTYFVYKTVNTLTGQFYVGVHGGSISDGYLGSGKLLKAAILKYGANNFKVERRIVCGSANEAYELEALIVTEEIVNHPMSYNLALGGFGGPHLRQRKRYKKRKGVKQSEAQKAKMSSIKKNMTGETKAKLSKSAALRSSVKLVCPYCSYRGIPPNVYRYHFNNCKMVGVL